MYQTILDRLWVVLPQPGRWLRRYDSVGSGLLFHSATSVSGRLILAPSPTVPQVMSAANGHSAEAPTVVAEARPVVLMRYRPGAVGQTARTVRTVPLPLVRKVGVAGVALCEALLCPDQVEMVTPGEGVPCSLCLISQIRAEPPPSPTATTSLDASIGACGPQDAAAAYQAWGWPVTQHRNEVWLTLEPDIVALIIPSPLALRVTVILRQRRRPPPVFAHPDTPGHWIVLAGEPYGWTWCGHRGCIGPAGACRCHPPQPSEGRSPG